MLLIGVNTLLFAERDDAFSLRMLTAFSAMLFAPDVEFLPAAEAARIRHAVEAIPVNAAIGNASIRTRFYECRAASKAQMHAWDTSPSLAQAIKARDMQKLRRASRSIAAMQEIDAPLLLADTHASRVLLFISWRAGHYIILATSFSAPQTPPAGEPRLNIEYRRRRAS